MPMPNNERKPALAWGAIAALFIASVGWAYGTGARLSAVETRNALMEERLAALERTITDQREVLQRIDSRLSHMEGTLDEMRKR